MEFNNMPFRLDDILQNVVFDNFGVPAVNIFSYCNLEVDKNEGLL
jgi:hypothetical protein